jgi:hypothetical protein
MCSTNNKLSFHKNGFWFHLTFSSETVAKDQHGLEWTKQGNRLVSAGGSFEYEMPKPKAGFSNKDYFMDQREQWANYFVNRAYNIRH